MIIELEGAKLLHSLIIIIDRQDHFGHKDINTFFLLSPSLIVSFDTFSFFLHMPFVYIYMYMNKFTKIET